MFFRESSRLYDEFGRMTAMTSPLLFNSSDLRKLVPIANHILSDAEEERCDMGEYFLIKPYQIDTNVKPSICEPLRLKSYLQIAALNSALDNTGDI